MKYELFCELPDPVTCGPCDKRARKVPVFLGSPSLSHLVSSSDPFSVNIPLYWYLSKLNGVPSYFVCPQAEAETSVGLGFVRRTVTPGYYPSSLLHYLRNTSQSDIREVLSLAGLSNNVDKLRLI
jgi:hypothetical protein